MWVGGCGGWVGVVVGISFYAAAVSLKQSGSWQLKSRKLKC